MLKKKRFKLLNLVMLALILVVSIGIPSFASNDTTMVNSGLKTKYQVVDNNSFIITENNKKSLISQKQYGDKTITTLKDLETNNEEYFIRDEVKGTIYSSITGKTINLDTSNNDNVRIKTLRTDEDRLIARHSISYTTIEYLVGAGGSASAMATAILAYKGIPIAAGIALIVTVILELGDMTAGALALKYPNGGIRFEEWRVVMYFQGLPEYRTVLRNVGHTSRL